MIYTITTATGWLLLGMGMVIMCLSWLADNSKKHTMTDQDAIEMYQQRALDGRIMSRYIDRGRKSLTPMRITVEIQGEGEKQIYFSSPAQYPVSEVLDNLAQGIAGWAMMNDSFAEEIAAYLKVRSGAGPGEGALPETGA